MSPRKKKETPTDLYFNFLLTYLDVADCEVKIRGIFFNSALTSDDEATSLYFNFSLTFGMVDMFL